MMIEDVVSKVVGIAGLFQKGRRSAIREVEDAADFSNDDFRSLIAVVNLAKGFGSTFRLT